jgi:hypothetical protein
MIDSFKLDCEVTSEDIQNGLRFDCGNCPVALAIRRAALLKFPESTALRVEVVVSNTKLSDVEIPGNNPAWLWFAANPLPVEKFILTFDGGFPNAFPSGDGNLKPFKFSLTFREKIIKFT